MRASDTFWLLLLGIPITGFYFIVPRIGSCRSDQARNTAACCDINGGIKSALDAYRVDTGNFPRTLQDLVQPPGGSTNWRGPYLDRMPVDPWGDAYLYEYPGKHNPNSYDLMSAGPDGKPGTKDDLGNWMK